MAAHQFSTAAIAEVKQRYWTWLLLMPVLSAPVLYSSLPADSSLTVKMVGFATGLAFLEAVIIISSRIYLPMLKNLTLNLYSDSIERSSGRLVETIKFADITQVDVYEKPSGNLAYVKVKAAPNKTWYLFGFEGMGAIAQHLERAVSDSSKFQRKGQVVDWGNPLILAVFSIPLAAAFLFFLELGRDAFFIWIAALTFAGGANSLIYRPLTQHMGAQTKRFETIAGMTLVTLAIGLAVNAVLRVANIW